MKIKAAISFTILFIIFCHRTFSQDVSRQLWTSGFAHFTFKTRVRLLTELSFRQALNQDDNWKRYQNQYDFRYSLLNKFDLHGGIFLVYTLHNPVYEDLNAFEIRPFIGLKYHITQNRKVNIRDYIRFESRFFSYTYANKNENFNRFRNRLELIAAINRASLNEDKLLYFNVDGEIFFNISKTAEERFANFFQVRMGPGYRFNYNWRLELYYVAQQSRNSASTTFSSNSHIAFFRVLYYFVTKKEYE